MAENLALKAASLYAEGSTQADIGKELDISRSRVGNLIREAIKSMEKHDGGSDEVTDEESEGKTEKNEEDEDGFFPAEFSDKDLDGLMTKTLLINATPILRKIALNSKVYLQHEYFQKQLGYTGDVGDLLVEALNFYWQEMGFKITISQDSVM